MQDNTHAEVQFQVVSNFTEIALRHGCSPVNLLHIFRALFPKNTSGQQLLIVLHHRCLGPKYTSGIPYLCKSTSSKNLPVQSQQ